MRMRDLRDFVQRAEGITDECKVRLAFHQQGPGSTMNYHLEPTPVIVVDREGEGFVYLGTAGQVYREPYLPEEIAEQTEQRGEWGNDYVQ